MGFHLEKGIRECEIIQWFVEPGTRVEQFDRLCEVQSDKASVEITSRFDGIVRRLHYEAGETASVGKVYHYALLCFPLVNTLSFRFLLLVGRYSTFIPFLLVWYCCWPLFLGYGEGYA
jgi:hypothetical protein